MINKVSGRGSRGMNTRILNRVASVIVCLGAVIPTSSFAAETNAVPESFKASIGGFLGTCYSVELREGSLYYSAAYPPQKTRL